MYNFKGINIEINIEGIKRQNTLNQDIQINPADLDTEFKDQALKFIYWATLSELAKDLANRKKYELDMFYARLDHSIRQNAVVNNIKLTEKMVENTVVTNEEYQKAMKEYNEARKQAGILQVAKEAFNQRKDMLVSLGANYRAEGSADPILLKEAAKQKLANKAINLKKEKKND